MTDNTVKSIIFEFPFLPPSLNTMLGKNRWKLVKEKEEFEHKATIAILSHGHFQIEGQVRILVDLCFIKKRRRDLDNYTGGLKWLIDMFRKLAIIQDDDSSIVKELNVQIYDGEKENRMMVKIEEVTK